MMIHRSLFILFHSIFSLYNFFLFYFLSCSWWYDCIMIYDSFLSFLLGKSMQRLPIRSHLFSQAYNHSRFFVSLCQTLWNLAGMSPGFYLWKYYYLSFVAVIVVSFLNSCCTCCKLAIQWVFRRHPVVSVTIGSSLCVSLCCCFFWYCVRDYFFIWLNFVFVASFSWSLFCRWIGRLSRLIATDNRLDPASRLESLGLCLRALFHVVESSFRLGDFDLKSYESRVDAFLSEISYACFFVIIFDYSLSVNPAYI